MNIKLSAVIADERLHIFHICLFIKAPAPFLTTHSPSKQEQHKPFEKSSFFIPSNCPDCCLNFWNTELNACNTSKDFTLSPNIEIIFNELKINLPYQKTLLTLSLITSLFPYCFTPYFTEQALFLTNF